MLFRSGNHLHLVEFHQIELVSFYEGMSYSLIEK